MTTVSASQSLRIAFRSDRPVDAAAGEGVVPVAVPLLAGDANWTLLEGGELREEGAFQIIETPTRIAGIVTADIDGSLEPPSFAIYRELLEVLGGRQLHRAWNYVPAINADHGSLENYRAFNIGRHRAFEDRFGSRCSARMAPASAVGVAGDRLVVAFLGGGDRIDNVENPEQIPAYRYPAEHGPKSPSFTRGAFGVIDGTPTGFVSGTSSIKDHRSIGTDLGTQFSTTIDNIRIVCERLGFAGALGAPEVECDYNFYLRRPDDLGAARELFRGVVGDTGVRRTRFLLADICRAELLLEIEAIFHRR